MIYHNFPIVFPMKRAIWEYIPWDKPMAQPTVAVKDLSGEVTAQ